MPCANILAHAQELQRCHQEKGCQENFNSSEVDVLLNTFKQKTYVCKFDYRYACVYSLYIVLPKRKAKIRTNCGYDQKELDICSYITSCMKPLCAAWHWSDVLYI